MGKALYRKYRSKKLSEIVGQEHITTTLQNALDKGVVSHAYLFTGPRGVGKTSIARILAHEVNNLPYDDTAHLDIIEIDAASNRRIDEIRDLRDHVHSAPSSGKYKVYIIDEVHMLTKEAFNALLKTLEEPPAHVIFILATTESHKLPETIVSRTQRFTFRPVEHLQAVEHLRSIAKSEGVELEDEAVNLIAEHGQGSFRDSISLLDQVSAGRTQVGADHVRSTLGIAPAAAIESLITAIELGSATVILQTLEDLRSSGYHAPQLAKQLAKSLRYSLIENTSPMTRQQLAGLLKSLIDVPASHDPDTLLELALLKTLPDEPAKEIQTKTAEKPVKKHVTVASPVVEKPPVSQPKQATIVDQPNEEPIDETPPAEEPTPTTRPDSPESEPVTVELTKKEILLDENSWQTALASLKSKHNTLYGVARMASPTFTDNTVTLSFKFPFHQKRLDDPKNKTIIAGVLSEVMGTQVSIVCLVDDSRKTPSPKKADKTDSLENISNIFGGAEVLE